MAAACVQVAKTVNLHHDDGEPIAGPLGARHFPSQQFIEISAIQEAGQLVNPGSPFGLQQTPGEFAARVSKMNALLDHVNSKQEQQDEQPARQDWEILLAEN